MIYTAKELLSNGETEYSIKKKTKDKKLFLVHRGVYSDEPSPYIDEVFISTKYPKAVFTGLSAFFIYELTDFVPDKYYLATEQHSFPIRRNDIVQTYQDPSFFNVGLTEVEINNGKVKIYNLERTLIELIRLKEKYPKDIYYEVLNSFRGIKHKLDFYKINEYSKHFRNSASLISKIKEVI